MKTATTSSATTEARMPASRLSRPSCGPVLLIEIGSWESVDESEPACSVLTRARASSLLKLPVIDPRLEIAPCSVGAE